MTKTWHDYLGNPVVEGDWFPIWHDRRDDCQLVPWSAVPIYHLD